MVADAYWEPPFTEGELTAFQQAHAANVGREAPPPQAFTNAYPVSAVDAALMFGLPDDGGMSITGQPPNTLNNLMPGNAAPSSSSNHGVDQRFDPEVTAFPTSSDFLAAGALPDSDSGQATLAMWSNVPTNFE